MKFLFLFILLILAAYYVISNERSLEPQPCYMQSELLNTISYEHDAITSHLFSQEWSANWICHPTGPYRDYGIFLFRKVLQLETKPEKFVIHVTADNFYNLFINGTKVSKGPAKSSLGNWEFESIDIAPFLKTGENVISAIVCNYGVHSPVWQLSYQAGFLIQGNSEMEQVINSNETWKCFHCTAYSPITYKWGDFPGFYALGPGDRLDGNLMPWQWRSVSFNDQDWHPAKVIGKGNTFQLNYWNTTPWLLQKRSIPFVTEGPVIHNKEIIRQENVEASAEFLSGSSPIKIAAHTKASLLLDLQTMTTAYPEIIVHGGENAEIKITYAESLWKVVEVKDAEEKITDKIYLKGNRNDFTDKVILGNWDIFVADGSQRLFSPLFWRTWRFMQVDIQTQTEPLILCDIRGRFTSYPYEQKATFETNQPLLQKIWEIGWRTTQLCANDLFLDSPYYEQLNYGADGRIQALIAYTHTNDDRLAKRSIEMLAHSIQSSGLTQDRYPSKIPQYIPTWSLDWIQMVYDFWMYRQDTDFVKKQLPIIRMVLAWFEQRIDLSTGLWNSNATSDWNTPPERITMEYLLALKAALKMEKAIGSRKLSSHYSKILETIKTSLRDHYLDTSSQTLMSPNLARLVNSLYVLCDIPTQDEQQLLMQQTMLYPYIGDKDDFFANYYWLYFMHEAMRKCGLGNLYLDVLNPWEEMIDQGLTTWAESFPPTRSDCHGWSCCPSIHFLTLVCGIQPSEAGFRSVRIEPFLGNLKAIKASMPHPMGIIEMQLKRKKNGEIYGTITLPPSLSGEFIWGNTKIQLKPGSQEVHINN